LLLVSLLFSDPAHAYSVQSGDTPGNIAQKHGLTTQELLKANPGLDPRKMRVGQEVTIPGGKSQPAGDAKSRPEDKTAKKPAETQDKAKSDDKAKADDKAKPSEAKADKAPAAAAGSYTVQKGDTPQTIAAKMGISVPELLKANDNLDPRKLRVGQVLKAPGAAPAKAEKAEPKAEAKAEAKKDEAAAVKHTVKRGETLAAIAAKYGTTIAAIQRINPAASSGKVKTGTLLSIPAGQAVAPPADAPSRATPPAAERAAADLPLAPAETETPAAQAPAAAPESAAAEPETGAPTDAEGYFEKGNELGKQNKYQKAIEQFDRAIKLNPNRADYYASRGHAFYYMKLYTRAIEDYTQAIERNASFALAYSMRGLSRTRDGQFDKAIADYNKAISLGPKEADYYKGRGYTYFHLKQYGPMCDDYQKACSLGDCELLETARKENLCKAGG
jgi:LysM repeat protein